MHGGQHQAESTRTRKQTSQLKPADHNGSISLEEFNHSFEDDEYSDLSRAQLQFQCEALGINANQKTETLRAALRSASADYDMDEEIDSDDV